MTTVSEPINVWVLFKKSLIFPHLFFWNNRPIKVDKINLTYTSRSGSDLFYHFSISAAGNFYQICYDTSKQQWHLEAVEEE